MERKIGIRLRELRCERGISRKEVSMRSGISEDDYAKIEEKGVLGTGTLAAISMTLGVRPEEITGVLDGTAAHAVPEMVIVAFDKITEGK